MEKQVTFHDLATHLRMLLESESYSQTTVKDMDFILNSFASYMDKNGLDVYSPEIGERLIQYCEVELKVCASRVSRARVIVRKLNRLNQGLDGREALWGDKTSPIVLPADFEKILSAYISYCRRKGDKQTTLHYKQWICSRFLKNLSSSGCEKAEDISGDMVQSAFLQLKFSRYWERIGPFLRFLFEKGYTKLNYSMLIQHRKRNSPYPTVYSVDEITTVESSIDRATPAGIRNYAIIMLLSRYGIRSSDIAALSFENIDFTNNRIRFLQQKTDDPWESELFPEVKDALLDYIQNVRPEVSGCSQIFMTLVIPYQPMDCFAINTMVWTQFGKSGVPLAERRHGSRAFRSSMASNMINDNISTEIVRRVLGHGTKHAIKHYARIDIESMRLCPLAVPEPGGLFAEMLLWKDGDNHV